MAKPFLVNNPVQTIMDSTGTIVNGAKVFTYQAGTTTKLTTYPTQTDAINNTNANTNPLISNSVGKIGQIWATQAIKLVYSPSDDTDPPTNSFTTNDNITQLAQSVTNQLKTGNYTASISDRDSYISCDASSGSFTIILPLASTAGQGFYLRFKKIDSSLNGITIQPSGSDTIDGQSSLTMKTQWTWIECECDGTQWLTSLISTTQQIFYDTNSKEILGFITAPNAVNYFTITNSATGSGPILTSAGSDSNIDLNLVTKGTGKIVPTGSFAASQFASTLGVTGAVTLSSTLNAGASTLSSLGVTGLSTFGGVCTLNGGATTFNGTNSAQSSLILQGNTTNNNNTITVQPAANIPSSWTMTLPSTPGTNLYVLQTNGSGVTTWAPVLSNFSLNVQVFTSNGTYTPHANLIGSLVKMVGGGAGGQTSTGSGNTFAAGGGGAGGYIEAYLTPAQIGVSQSITIGGGGSAGSSGGTTSVGSLLSCAGGATGTNAVSGAGGAGGTATITTGSGVTVQGAAGGTGMGGSSVAGAFAGGMGGTSFFGGPGAGTGAAATGHGAGGNGGGQNGGSTGTGGAGSGGIVYILEFILA